jgi:hypothetical protein
VSLLTDTNLEIRARLLAERRRRAEEARALLPMRLIDGLLADLEDQHLGGRKRVPESFDERLCQLQEACPAARAYELRSRITIVHLMDQLYEIQQLLLEAKAGAAWTDPSSGGQSLPEAS